MADEESTTEEVIEEAETAVEDAAVDERPLPEEAVLAGIVEPHLSATWVIAPDEWVVTVDSAEYHGLVALAQQSGFDTFIDLCAVDYFRRDPRFEVVVTLLDYSTPMRLRVRVGVAAEEPALVTISDLFIGANFYEREAYDMYGIEFTGHPDLTRILMPDDWEGHPLRKDYAVGAVPVQFKDAPKAQ